MIDSQVSLAIRTYAASTLNYILLYDREGHMKKKYFTDMIPTILKAIETKNTNIDSIFVGLNI